MDSLDEDFAAGVFADPEPPCLSLYQPTHRARPENEQDLIRFRNLVKRLEESLRQRYPKRDVWSLMEPFEQLAGDSLFWEHTCDGLVVFRSPALFRVYRLQRPIAEMAVVADSFHLKPLLRVLQSASRFHVLGLTRQKVKLFEGNRYALDPVELPPEAAKAIAEARETGGKEQHVEVRPVAGGPAPRGVRGGYASRKDLATPEDERVFRAVDRAILAHYSRPSGLPLLLVAVPENQAVFRRVSRNPMLMPQGLEVHPDSLSIEELRERAWRVVEPYYLDRLAGLTDMFQAAWAKGLGTDDLAHAMRAAVAGRVSTLLVDASVHIPGRVDMTTGAIEFDDLASPGVDDLIDDLAELVLKGGGEVVVVPSERMPTRSGLAAIFRF